MAQSVICETNLLGSNAISVFLPFTSASSSLVLSLSIFSFQSLERSFSIHDESKKDK